VIQLLDSVLLGKNRKKELNQVMPILSMFLAVFHFRIKSELNTPERILAIFWSKNTDFSQVLVE